MKRIFIGAAIAAMVAGMASLPANALAETSTTVTETTTAPSGRMTIVSQEQRTFRLGTETKVYTAPTDADLAALSGQDVRITVAPSGTVSKVTKVRRTETHTED